MVNSDQCNYLFAEEGASYMKPLYTAQNWSHTWLTLENALCFALTADKKNFLQCPVCCIEKGPDKGIGSEIQDVYGYRRHFERHLKDFYAYKENPVEVSLPDIPKSGQKPPPPKNTQVDEMPQIAPNIGQISEILKAAQRLEMLPTPVNPQENSQPQQLQEPGDFNRSNIQENVNAMQEPPTVTSAYEPPRTATEYTGHRSDAEYTRATTGYTSSDTNPEYLSVQSIFATKKESNGADNGAVEIPEPQKDPELPQEMETHDDGHDISDDRDNYNNYNDGDNYNDDDIGIAPDEW